MNGRNIGIDALRIISMLFVVTLHCLGHGGVLENAKGMTYYASYGLEAAAFCAVNCFVLITGYCSCRSTIRAKRITSLWVQALFYSVAIVACLAMLHSDLLADKHIPSAFTPVLSNQWWFFTQYFALVFAMPVLNLAISKLEGPDAWKTIFAIGFVFTIMPLVSQSDLFKLSGGYSFVWFVVLYLTGGALNKLSEAGWHPSSDRCFAVYIAAVIVTWAPTALASMHITAISDICKTLPTLYSYASPTIYLSSIALFCAFKETSIKSDRLKKAIEWVAPSVFAVYLISDHRLIRASLITDSFAPFTSAGAAATLLIVTTSVIGIFVVCVLIEKLRVALFDLIGITALVNRASEWIDRLLARAFNAHAHESSASQAPTQYGS